MAKKREKPFRNFTLLELSHLRLGEIVDAETGTIHAVVKILQQRLLGVGKKVIDTETKPGDTILIEDPRKVTLDISRKIIAGTEFEKFAEWFVFAGNIYYRLAEYAKSKGRKVESLEPSVINYSKGRIGLRRMLLTNPGPRLNYIVATKRDKFFITKIQRRKPKLVIAASGHAAYLEKTLRPKKTIYSYPDVYNTLPVTNRQKEESLKNRRKKNKEYFSEKRIRRQRINAEKGLRMKKGWKKRMR